MSKALNNYEFVLNGCPRRPMSVYTFPDRTILVGYWPAPEEEGKPADESCYGKTDYFYDANGDGRLSAGDRFFTILEDGKYPVTAQKTLTQEMIDNYNSQVVTSVSRLFRKKSFLERPAMESARADSGICLLPNGSQYHATFDPPLTANTVTQESQYLYQNFVPQSVFKATLTIDPYSISIKRSRDSLDPSRCHGIGSSVMFSIPATTPSTSPATMFSRLYVAHITGFPSDSGQIAKIGFEAGAWACFNLESDRMALKELGIANGNRLDISYSSYDEINYTCHVDLSPVYL